MENTSGFYKIDNGQLFFGANFVESKEYQLYSEHHEEYNYPIDGWYWFESEADAREFFKLPEVEEV